MGIDPADIMLAAASSTVATRGKQQLTKEGPM